MVGRLKAHWFHFLLPFWLAVAWSVSISPESIADPRTTERVFLFDLCLFLPTLYFLFLRRKIGARGAVIRAVALAGAGVWVAGWLIQPGTGEIIPAMSMVRWMALPILIVIELAAFVAVMRYLYGTEPIEQELIRQGLPPLIARLMIAEARFWKRVFRLLSGKAD